MRTILTEPAPPKPRRSAFRRWLRLAFLTWAVVSTLWLANSMRTRGVQAHVLRTGNGIQIADTHSTLAFLPEGPPGRAGLIFFCGAGVSAAAYAPLLRPVAEAGYPVHVVRLPYRFAPFQSHKSEAISRARAILEDVGKPDVWVVSGHSLGGALAARLAQAEPLGLSALVLIGTTHPKECDLSFLRVPVTKVYASNDGVAPQEKVLANRRLLPPHTRWVEIAGGNHSQFGHYGHQLFDGEASLSREDQQAMTRSVLLETLSEAER